jgi:hypothetical protein
MLNVFHFYMGTFRSVCAVPDMAVFAVPSSHIVLSRYAAQVFSE